MLPPLPEVADANLVRLLLPSSPAVARVDLVFRFAGVDPTRGSTGVDETDSGNTVGVDSETGGSGALGVAGDSSGKGGVGALEGGAEVLFRLTLAALR